MRRSSPCGTYSERRDVILWRLISMREIRLTCRDHFSLLCSHTLGIYSLKGIMFIAQWQATLGASPWVVDERKLRPVKGKSPKWQTVRFFTFAPNRAHHAGDAYPGCRLTPFALPWAMDSLGFQPVTHYSLLTDAAPQGISVNSCSFVVLNKTNFRGHPLRTAPVFPCK